MIPIKVPPLGESIVEATIARWLKQEGDAVAQGDTLVELETDKITVEVPALKAGVLARQAKKEGDVVQVDETLGEVDETASAAAAAAPSAAAAAPANAGGAQRVTASPAAAGAAAATAAQAEPAAPAAAAGAAKTSPSVRRIAAEEHVDVTQVPGTGRAVRAVCAFRRGRGASNRRATRQRSGASNRGPPPDIGS